MTSFRVLRPAVAAGMLILALAACGSDGGDKKADAPAAAGGGGDQIEVKNFSFKPENATVKVGTKVTWTFKDDAAHTVEPTGGSEPAKSQELKNGATYSFTFTKPGMMSYRCSIHNYMTGAVMVTA